MIQIHSFRRLFTGFAIPALMGTVKLAVSDDTSGNNIQLYQHLYPI